MVSPYSYVIVVAVVVEVVDNRHVVDTMLVAVVVAAVVDVHSVVEDTVKNVPWVVEFQ
jgi:hypothetical protein